LLWPPFKQAARESPWVGWWGLGASNAIIPPDREIARLIQSWAAHHEYLRMQVEGGEIGRGLLVGLFVQWVVRHTRAFTRTEKLSMRLVVLGFAVHSFIDNVLISTTACVFFTFSTAVFASGRLLNTSELA